MGYDTVLNLLATQEDCMDCMGSLSRAYTCPAEAIFCPTYHISQEVMAKIEIFIILLCDRTSTCSEINNARRKMFAKRHNVQSTPQTKASLEKHVKKAVYQGGCVWGQMLVSTPELPLLCRWGWSKTSEGYYEPLWTCLPDSGQSSYELISCKCKKGCFRHCIVA